MPDEIVRRAELGDALIMVRYKDMGDGTKAPVGEIARHTVAFENNANGDPIYIGKAEVGSSKAAAVWQIQRLTYSGTDLTDMQWADGNTDFDNVWNDRAGLSYS